MLRSTGPDSEKVDNESVEKRRADVEIINMVKCKLEVGSVLNMKETNSAYNSAIIFRKRRSKL